RGSIGRRREAAGVSRQSARGVSARLCPQMRRRFAAAAIPALAAAIFIAAFGTNVPFWDEWDLAGVIEKLARHQVTVADFFAPQSEHRFVSAKLILAPLALVTHWNVIVELWLSFAVAVLGYLGLLRLMRDADTATAK